MNKRILQYVGIIAVIATMEACSAGPNDTGRSFMPDMQYPTAVEAYDADKVEGEFENAFSATATARIPDSRSIPRGYVPEDESVRTDPALMKSYLMKNYFRNWNFQPAAYQALYDSAGMYLKNPLTSSAEHMEAGKRLYNIQCAVCHGKNGAGDGSIVVLADGSDGPYTAIPPNYKDRLPGLKDGNIFYSVSYGKGAMGGYAHALTPEQRWQVILYIKDMAGMNDPAVEETTEEGTDEAMEVESPVALAE